LETFLYWEISDWSCWNYHGRYSIKNADIEGKFEGTIRVAEILNVKAQWLSREKSRKLSVEPGADFSASCVMKINEENLLITDGRNPKKTI
jgi:hypothetical protein